MSTNTIVDVEALSDLIALGLEDDQKGGTIRVTIRGAEGGGIFANVCPKSVKSVDAIAKAAHSAIMLDWHASGKKEARAYLLTIRDKDQNIRTERVFAFSAEEVTTKDIENQALATSLLAIQGAQQTIQHPYELLREQLADERKSRGADRDEIATLRARNRELEQQRQNAADELAAFKRAHEGAAVSSAQAEAALIEARGKAAAWGDFGKAAINNTPVLLGIGAKLLGIGPAHGRALPPGALDTVTRIAGGMAAPPGSAAPATAPSAPATIVGAAGYTPPPCPMSPEAWAQLQALARTLTPEEASRLCKFAWDADPNSMTLLGLFAPEHTDAVMGVVRLVARDWGLA